MLLRRRSEKAEALKKVPLFSGLNGRQLDIVAREADEVTVAAGKTLAKQGKLGHEFLLIVAGTARVERDGLVLASLGPGDCFGEMSLIDGKPRIASVIAETQVTLLVINSRSFSLVLDAVPALQKKILVTLCERLRVVDEALASRN